eukprot:726335-Rhodomonas_salina.3
MSVLDISQRLHGERQRTFSSRTASISAFFALKSSSSPIRSSKFELRPTCCSWRKLFRVDKDRGATVWWLRRSVDETKASESEGKKRKRIRESESERLPGMIGPPFRFEYKL